jgi:hypothetical protein
VQDHNLRVAARARADADGDDADTLCNEFSKLAWHEFEDDGKCARVF